LIRGRLFSRNNAQKAQKKDFKPSQDETVLTRSHEGKYIFSNILISCLCLRTASANGLARAVLSCEDKYFTGSRLIVRLLRFLRLFARN
jgi:hypothetical protein